VNSVIVRNQNIRHEGFRIGHGAKERHVVEERKGKEVVGTTGFEPATSRTPSVRATRLRHVPTLSSSNERITRVREGSRWREVPRANRAGISGARASGVPDGERPAF